MILDTINCCGALDNIYKASLRVLYKNWSVLYSSSVTTEFSFRPLPGLKIFVDCDQMILEMQMTSVMRQTSTLPTLYLRPCASGIKSGKLVRCMLTDSKIIKVVSTKFGRRRNC